MTRRTEWDAPNFANSHFGLLIFDTQQDSIKASRNSGTIFSRPWTSHLKHLNDVIYLAQSS